MAVSQSVVARVLGIDAQFTNFRTGAALFLPQHVGILAQGRSDATYSTDKFQISSATEAGQKYGFGSPIHLIARELLPANGDGVGTIPVTVHPLEDGYEAVAATGDITPSGTATKAASYRVRVGGVLSDTFVVPKGSVDAEAVRASMTTAINAVLHMPMTAADGSGKTDLTAKWAGPTGNMKVEIIGEDVGVTFTITQPNGGLVNPTVTDALNQIGNVWETMLVSGLNIDDTDALDEYQTFGEGRWGELVHKPLVVFTGNTATTVSAATSVSSTRRTDRVNAQLVAPGSVNLPFVVAARQVARIARLADSNPPHDYGSQRATGLIPGDDGDQWNHTKRDQAVKAGSSTVEVKDGVVNVSDVVTFYRPEGEEPPGYRYVVDIVKVMNSMFNFDVEFNSPEWDGAPLIPDGQATTNPTAKTPSMAKSTVGSILDLLGLAAIISDPTTAKKNTKVTINGANPKRLDFEVPLQVSGNTNVKDMILRWGFFFG